MLAEDVCSCEEDVCCVEVRLWSWNRMCLDALNAVTLHEIHRCLDAGRVASGWFWNGRWCVIGWGALR